MVKRPDRRTEYSQLRQFSAAQNLLHQADGSAKFDFGETSVLASVVGPIEVPLRDEKLDESTVEVVVRPAVGIPTTKEKLFERILLEALEPMILGGVMPRTLVQIVIQINKDDGSVLSAAMNAATLALLDAGIPLKYMAAGVTCMIENNSKEIVMDPTSEELENASSVHTFAFDNSGEPHIALSDSSGDFSTDQYFACHDKCYNAVDKVHGFLRASVETKKYKENQQMEN
ncbi:ribosomal protein S5 domain 2-type protein [Syncephalastrum racemosum]|uniref:Ribosomal protein S5 domain 2-type protein n=1 Tax=Syncephalastrum racemosum TaxID=13706 RepID=A0A1X2HQ85_SYNRA|nr:ribosomal protein S5 domain 2-type protein [Syncephalastrum racemosum]